VKRGTPVVLATGNAGKVREFNRLLAGAFDVLSLPSGVALPAETGRTFAANARLKAQAVFETLGGVRAVLADDSGLEVSALGGMPGIYSARFAGERATDTENVAKLLAEIDGASDRSAQFVCALCLVVPEDAAAGARSDEAVCACRFLDVEGVTKGTVTLAPRGLDGFGYDPVFQPIGWEVTLAEASPEDKDRVSHRGAAARALLDCLGRRGEA
jgi:non-canonical purine NTP pyrophosphatase (RdgB/HAM1 family)